MKKYLVIGNPIEHSLSPKLHNYWIKENNIDAVYDKKQLNETDIKAKSRVKRAVPRHAKNKIRYLFFIFLSSCSFLLKHIL